MVEEFISIDDAIRLIDKDTRKDPVVDVDYMVNASPYIRVNGNFTIKLLTRAADGRIVENGVKFVQIASEWDKSRLKHAIFEHYKNATGKEIIEESIGLKSLTTTIDEDKNPSGMLRAMDKPMTKLGDSTNGGSQVVEE